MDLRFKAVPQLHQRELIVEALEPGGGRLHPGGTGGEQTSHLGNVLRGLPDQIEESFLSHIIYRDGKSGDTL
jgi:hypothetical protein